MIVLSSIKENNSPSIKTLADEVVQKSPSKVAFNFLIYYGTINFFLYV